MTPFLRFHNLSPSLKGRRLRIETALCQPRASRFSRVLPMPLGLPTGASANKSIASMPGATWCSTAFTDPYRALQPEIRKQHNHVVSFVAVEPTTVDCPTSAGRQPPSRDLPPCVVSIHTEFRDIAQAHSSPS